MSEAWKKRALALAAGVGAAVLVTALVVSFVEVVSQVSKIQPEKPGLTNKCK